MSNLNLRNIYKVYPNGTKAVNDFNLDIEDKEFIVFVGPSGCGKSTVLRMIAGLEEITAGELKIGGRVVNDVDCMDRDTAMVFQNYALYPHLTVADNIAFPLKMAKLTKAEKVDLRKRTDARYPLKSANVTEESKKEKGNSPFLNRLLRPLHIWQQRREDMYTQVLRIAKILDLEEYLGKKPGAMSGGQRQRVALGRAMVRNPQVFLLDEPLSNLDAKLRTQMRSEITKLHNRLQTTFIYVTHDQVEAMTMGDRIVVMRKGEIQQTDTPINLYTYPENMFVAGFIGTPAMNFFGAVVRQDGTKAKVEIADGKVVETDVENFKKFQRKYFGKEVVLGVRPEHICMDANGVECVVLNTEMLGSETLLYCDFATENATNYENGKFPFIMKVGGACNLASGEKIKVSFNFSAVHFFDKETEECVMKRFVSCNEVSATVEDKAFVMGGVAIALPEELSALSGQFTVNFPVEAVVLGGEVSAKVLECEQLRQGWLTRLQVGSEKIYALFNEEQKGTVSVDFDWHKFTFVGETSKQALSVENKLPVTVVKRKLTKEQIKALPDGEVRDFDADVQCQGVSLPLPAAVLKRLLGASDRKLFGRTLYLCFDEDAVTSEETFRATTTKVYNYGSKVYSQCNLADATVVLPYLGESFTFGIDLNKAALVDPDGDIKLT